MDDAAVAKAIKVLRNFQVMQKDCENLRDQVALVVSPTDEKVSPPGQKFLTSKNSNCYKERGGSACVMLNCYSGGDDRVFKNWLREFEAKMLQCQPSYLDDITPPPERTAAAAPAKQ